VTLTGWADFVFEENYRLMPLSQLEDYIRTHGHLPDIPSTEEATNGDISLGEIQTKLLQKIEEMTLHLIRLEKENEELWRRLKSLDSPRDAPAAGPSPARPPLRDSRPGADQE
jgi:hypothetical protein